METFEKTSFAPFLAGALSSGSVSFARDHSGSFFHDKRYGIRSQSRHAYHGFPHFAGNLWPDNRHGPRVVPDEATVNGIVKARMIASIHFILIIF
jgi:hypothetical protein